MVTYARIEGGIVQELFSPPAGTAITACFQADLVWVECDQVPGVAPGWSYSGGTFTAPASSTPTLAQQAATMLATGCQIVSTSTSTRNATYACDSQTWQEVAGVLAQIAAGLGLPGGGSTFNWPDVAGTPHSFDAAGFKALATALSNFIYALQAIMNSNSGTLPQQPVTIA